MGADVTSPKQISQSNSTWFMRLKVDATQYFTKRKGEYPSMCSNNNEIHTIVFDIKILI